MFVVEVWVEYGQPAQEPAPYLRGPFPTEAAARAYAEAYHGELDKTRVLPLAAPIGD